VRKLYTLITAGYRHLGRPGEAMAACRAGRARCPDDAELLHFEATLRSEAGDLSGAEACLRQLTRLQPTSHFASLDEGLRGPGARHQLAQLYRQTGRLAEAESEWQAVVAEQPHFTPAWLGLAEVYLQTSRWPELDHAATQAGELDGAVLRARGCLARKDFAAARQLLDESIARHPNALPPRVILSHVLLQENRDLTAAERVLREVLERDPSLAESWRNLAILLRHQGRLAESLSACRSGRVHCPHEAELALFQSIVLREIGDLTGAETCLLRILESAAPPVADAPGSPGRVAHHFATARHNLALVYREQARLAEAETQWRAVLAEDPDWAAAWLGLGELYLEQRRWPELEPILTRLEAGIPTATDAALLRARAHMARKEYAAARRLLEATIARVPLALPPRIILGLALLQEGQDRPAAEKALRDVLSLASDHVETRHNLAVLLRQ
jgi:tetratricopeptide (TPR) repeat protein